MSRDIYERLALHMSKLPIGPPSNSYLAQMLRESLTQREAEILLYLPTELAPMNPLACESIAARVQRPEGEIATILDNLAARGMLYRGQDGEGREGYALHGFGYGMPQAVFWPNEDTPYARRMAELCIKHSTREALIEAFGGTGTKVYRWVPINRTVDRTCQAVLPYANMEKIIAGADVIAVVNCNCRVMSRLRDRKPCAYPLEVCMKYDELAEYVIHMGIGRSISKDESLAINLKAEEAGCVHFADNVIEGEVKHACNCCPCCCWSLGNLKRRRIPRDLIMACQFIRYTDFENCTGCGNCAEACPVDAVAMKNGIPEVDAAWCLGCGLCARSCPNDAVTMIRRDDTEDPLERFESLAMKRLAAKKDASRDESI